MADVFDLTIFHDLRESQLTRTHETHLWVQEREQEEGGQSTGQGCAAKEQGGGEEEERLAEKKWPELGSAEDLQSITTSLLAKTPAFKGELEYAKAEIERWGSMTCLGGQEEEKKVERRRWREASSRLNLFLSLRDGSENYN